MTLRVLHIGKFFPPHHGGMEVFLADLVQAQRAQGVEAYALVHGTPRDDDPEWLTRVPVQAQLIYAPIAIGFRTALASAIERHRPDVLHLHMPNNSVFWALTLRSARQLPWVVHWHSDVVASQISLPVRLAYRLYRPFEQAVLDRSERIIVTSPPYLQASEPLQRWLDRCAVVPLGLATQPTQQPEQTPATPYAWPEGCLRLLSIGRLTYYKGFETLIHAVAALPHVHLAIAGGGEAKAALQALIDQLTPPGQTARIQLLGPVTDAEKNELLETCDLFCLASRERTEAFGMVLLEAMQHARPCLVTDLPGSGMPWVVKSANAGLCVALENIAEWQQRIQQLQAAPEWRQQLGLNGQKALRERFDISICAHELQRQYRIATAAHPLAHHSAATRDLLIVIPARDEAATIPNLLRALKQAGWCDVLVIDDHSTDNTGALALQAGAHVVRPPLPLGAWGGMQAGIRYGLTKGYRGVITMDADGQHEVDEIPALLAQREHADIVIGAFPERASRLRQIAWEWFRRITGFDLRDLTSGFRHYNRAAMQVAASPEAILLDYQDLGALLLARRAGLSITEVPVKMNLRSVGKSRIFDSWASVAKYMIATTLLCVAK